MFVRPHGSNGNFGDHPVGELRDPIVASVELVKGIDYPDVLSAHADAWEHRQLKNDTPKPADISLIYRLLAG